MDSALLQGFLRQTEVLRAPRHRLATFGATSIAYTLISPIDDLRDRTRLRSGHVRSERPLILTAESLAQRFEGFGDDARELASFLSLAYRDLLRALEYNFKNQGFAARVLAEPPKTVAERVLADEENQAVVRCPDAGWALALMKLTLDESARSFPVNVRDLERRGLFDPAAKEADRRRREIESLFEAARADPEAREALGRVLRDAGLFAEYEDRFLSLYA